MTQKIGVCGVVYPPRIPMFRTSALSRMKVFFDIRVTTPLTKLKVLRHYSQTIESLSPRNTSL